jgi:hypothetical protein
LRTWRRVVEKGISKDTHKNNYRHDASDGVLGVENYGNSTGKPGGARSDLTASEESAEDDEPPDLLLLRTVVVWSYQVCLAPQMLAIHCATHLGSNTGILVD